MSKGDTEYITLHEGQLDLIVEAVEVLRLYQQGFPDEEGRIKLYHVRRLEQRLRRRQERQWRSVGIATL